MRRLLLLLALVVCALPATATAGPALPLVQGPDEPRGEGGVAVPVLTDERFEGCAGIVEVARDVQLPVWRGDVRFVLEFTGRPAGDPWDRMFSVAIGGVEVLRGTTPRTTFTVERDITEYARLLPSGGTVTVVVELASWVGAMRADVTLHALRPGIAPRAVADEVHGVFLRGSLIGSGERLSREIELPAEAPAGATVDLTLSNHADEEARAGGRVFGVYVDGTLIAETRPMPYTYAILGFGGENANTACRGPATSSTGDVLHPLMWWSAQRALDVAGVHTGVGEIPPYRAGVAPEHLPLLAGARTVEVRQQGGGPVWITSLAFLIDR